MVTASLPVTGRSPPVDSCNQRSGEAFVSNAVSGGTYVLRACIVNFHTGEADVDALPEIVARLGRAVDGELREGR